MNTTATTNPTVTTYRLFATNGKPIRQATRVSFQDGKSVSFLDRIPNRTAIAQATALYQRGIVDQSK